MPRTTVYIRDEDWDKWKSISNKSELISKAINSGHSHKAPEKEKDEHRVKPKGGKEVSTCKAGHATHRTDGRCMVKGCKYFYV